MIRLTASGSVPGDGPRMPQPVPEAVHTQRRTGSGR